MLYGIYVRFLSVIGKVVICDRYVQDTYLDFKNNFPSCFKPNSILWKLLNYFIPEPNVSFLLFVPVKVSQERSLLKNEPFPDSEETLSFRLKHYMDESLFPQSIYTRVDCQNSIKEIHQQIIENLKDLK